MGAGVKQLDTPVLLSSKKIAPTDRGSSNSTTSLAEKDPPVEEVSEKSPEVQPKNTSTPAARWRQIRRTTKSLRETRNIVDSTSTPRKLAPNTALTVVRWLASGQTTNARVENGLDPEHETLEFGTPPPIEEPQCYSVDDDDNSDDGKEPSFAISSEFLKAILIDHMRSVSGRSRLLRDLELDHVNADNIGQLLKACSRAELNALLLYASFLGRGDLIPGFHATQTNLHHAEPEHGITALHLCAFSDCLVGVWYLVRNGANVKAKKPYTPFQYAAFGNARQVAKYFLDEGVSQENPPGLDSVLHCAARSNALDVLKLVATPDNPALNRLDGNGCAPIHYVVEQGQLECLQTLLVAGSKVGVTTSKGETALHVAADAGCFEIVDLLLKKGADPTKRNQRGQTPLHLAAKAHSLESVQVLLRAGESNPNTEDKDGRTSLHVALGRSLGASDVTELLIAWKANVNKPDKYGYTPLHVAALSELSRCVDVLIQHGADLSAKTNGGTTALSIILRKTPSSLAFFKVRLDSAVALRQRGRINGEVEMKLDFHPLLEHRLEGEVGLLKVFVDEGYKDILEHPLCQSFLHVKWRKIRKYYFVRIVFYAVYVILLTFWVTTALAHNCFNESLRISNSSTTPVCVNSNRLWGGVFYDNPDLMKAQWYLLLFFTVLEITRKLAAGVSSFVTRRKFLPSVDTLSEWSVIVGVFLVSFVFTGRIYPWQSHVGAFVVICGWTNLMLMLGQLSVLGSCVAMFTRVQAKFFKILIAYACLLIGFTASFFVIFPHSKTFADPYASPVKVLAMMTGDLGFDDLFFPALPPGHDSLEPTGFAWFFVQFSTKVTFLCFLFFVTIVLMNLLVGIAVSDIQGLQKTAGLANLERRTNLICDLETTMLGLLPRRMLRHLRWTAFIVPSCIRAVLTVRPLNPMEKRLPQSVLNAAYHIAKQRMASNSCKSNSRIRGGLARSYMRIDPEMTTDFDDVDDGPGKNSGSEEFDVKREIIELKKICYQSQQLIEILISRLGKDDKIDS